MAKRTPWQIQRAVVFALLLREIKTRFGGRWTGYLWVFGIPIAKLAVYVLLNVFFRNRVPRQGYDFVVWLFIGMIPFDIFRDLWNHLTHAVTSNLALFGYRQVKPMDTFIARAILDVSIAVILYSGMAFGMSLFGYAPMTPADPLGFFVVVFVAILIGFGLGLCTAMFTNLLPRFDVFAGLLAAPLTLFSGVMFQLNNLPEYVLSWFRLNPLLHVVELGRQYFLGGYKPVNGCNLWYPLLFAVCLIALGMSMYRVRRRQLVST
jgi:capsular polysaccharide transport system permease protein